MPFAERVFTSKKQVLKNPHFLLERKKSSPLCSRHNSVIPEGCKRAVQTPCFTPFSELSERAKGDRLRANGVRTERGILKTPIPRRKNAPSNRAPFAPSLRSEGCKIRGPRQAYAWWGKGGAYRKGHNYEVICQKDSANAVIRKRPVRAEASRLRVPRSYFRDSDKRRPPARP